MNSTFKKIEKFFPSDDIGIQHINIPSYYK